VVAYSPDGITGVGGAGVEVGMGVIGVDAEVGIGVIGTWLGDAPGTDDASAGAGVSVGAFAGRVVVRRGNAVAVGDAGVGPHAVASSASSSPTDRLTRFFISSP